MHATEVAEDTLKIHSNLDRERWIKKSFAYYSDILKVLKFLIPSGARVLEVGCSTGWLLRKIENASHRVGVERDPLLVDFARSQGTSEDFHWGNFERSDFSLNQKFDFIIASDVVPFAYDIQLLFENCFRHLEPGNEGRVFVSCYNPYLKPIYKLAEHLGLKSPSKPENWVTERDIFNLAELAGFEVVRKGYRGLLPWNFLGLGRIINRWLAPLPIFKFFNLYFYALLRPRKVDQKNLRQLKSVSVVVPARNEAGNIRAARDRLPRLADRVELIYVEGNSKDNTWDTIQKVASEPHPDWMDIKVYKQMGRGKANAVHLGFAKSSGDVLVILDADLTVPPEDLPRFVEPLRSGIADFTHGDRLTYPMEGQAMQFLNMIANKFFGLSFTFVLGQDFKDTLCGTKVLWRSDWEKILALRSYFGDFDPFGDFELLFGSIKLNHKMVQIPIHYKARTYGETNIQRWHHGWILLKMLGFASPRMKFF